MTTMAPAAVQAEALNQFLTFVLGGEEYGLEILKVQEIRGSSAITPLPNTPPYMKGVMNLRGAVVPIIDMRERLGVERAADAARPVIVVVTHGRRVAGLIVDAVSDVLTVTPAERAAIPELGGVDTRMLDGLARAGERLVLLVNIENVLGGDLLAPEARS